MKHKHHVVPLHMGGTDDPSNIVELTIEEHAEAHRKLFEEHGRWQDELAWKGLAGMISQEEIIRRKIAEGSRNALKSRMNNSTPEQRSEAAKAGGHACYAKHKEKIDARLRANAKMISELGLSVAPPVGKWIWITDGVNNKKVLKTDKIPEGWYEGRNKNWQKAYTYCDYVEQDKKQCTYCKEWFVPRVLARWHNEKCSKWVTNGFEEKQIHFTDIVEEGWQEGRYKDTFTVETRTSNYPNPVMKKHCPVCDQLLDAGNFKLHVKSKKCSLTYEYADNKNKRKIQK